MTPKRPTCLYDRVRKVAEGVAGGVAPVLGSLTLLFIAFFPSSAIAQSEPTATPLAMPPGAQIHLPVLSSGPGTDTCSAWIAVQNVGKLPSKVVLLGWGNPGACGTNGLGPHTVECSGLLAPGRRWSFSLTAEPWAARGPAHRARSGAIFSFNAQGVVFPLSIGVGDQARNTNTVGATRPVDDVNADLMCETLYFGVRNSPEDYRRFKKAFDEGINFAGLSMPEVAGSPIRAQVYRRCQTADGSLATDIYSARVGASTDIWPRTERIADVEPPWDYDVPLVSAASDGVASATMDTSERLYIQNTGWSCASVEIWARPLGGCGVERRAYGLELAPGEQRALDAGAIRFPELGNVQAGSLRLSSDQRLALVSESRGPNWLASSEILAGGQAATAPLLRIDEAAGLTTRLHLLSSSDGTNGDVSEIRITVFDTAGTVHADQRVTLCPLGTKTIDLGDMLDPTSTAELGAARVEHLSPSGRSVVALAELLRRDERGRVVAAARYALEPVDPMPDTGTGLLALPILSHVPTSDLPSATFALHNAQTESGFTDAAVYFYDSNAFVVLDCQRLIAGQTVHLSPSASPALSGGFDGSALVSATYWEHPEVAPPGGSARNRPMLAAALVEQGRAVEGNGANALRALSIETLPAELATRVQRCVPDPSGRVPATPAPGEPRPIVLLTQELHLPLVLRSR